MDKHDIEDFVSFVKTNLSGDEKGQAQIFCDHLFRAFGHQGIYEANGQLELRVKEADSKSTKFIDYIWSPAGKDGVLIEMKS